MLISPGYNLFINLKSKSTSLYGLIGEIFGKIKKELSVPTFYYQDINSRLWSFLYNQNNRLNLMSLMYNYDFISEKKISEVFPNYQYLTNTSNKEDTENQNGQNEISSLSKSEKNVLKKFLRLKDFI